MSEEIRKQIKRMSSDQINRKLDIDKITAILNDPSTKIDAVDTLQKEWNRLWEEYRKRAEDIIKLEKKISE